MRGSSRSRASTSSRGSVLDSALGEGLRASFDGPARALRCAAALAVASFLAGTAKPGEVLTTSTVQDLVAGSGIDLAERGALGELRLFQRPPNLNVRMSLSHAWTSGLDPICRW